MLEDNLKKIIQFNINKILEYNPFSNFPGVRSNDEFSKLIKKDPAFSPFGLERKEYVLARFGGNLITSLHRKIGDIYEGMFTEILANQFNIEKTKLRYSLKIRINDELQNRTTDGLVLFKNVRNKEQRTKLLRLFRGKYKGFAHEVRSCYQIGDSKRIQADRDMGLALRHENLYPVMLIFCSTSLRSPVERLKQYWDVREGEKAFEYIKNITGYDLQHFLNENKNFIQQLMTKVFEMF